MNVQRELNGAFSGGDIIITALFPSAPPVVLGHATTVTYSTFREISDVRSLGRVGVKSFARGQRTVAGTMIFTMVNRHWLSEAKKSISYLNVVPVLRPDELPFFDLVITAANEYGQDAVMMLYGVSFVDEGATMSVENLFSENQQTYKAHDIRLFDNIQAAMTSSVSFADPALLPTYSLPPVKTEYTSPGLKPTTGNQSAKPNPDLKPTQSPQRRSPVID